jgi:hypothetical protein
VAMTSPTTRYLPDRTRSTAVWVHTISASDHELECRVRWSAGRYQTTDLLTRQLRPNQGTGLAPARLMSTAVGRGIIGRYEDQRLTERAI